ncbi:uncharacterized protein LOC118437954 [Folsomia candida]|uniref:Uncharacterized protein n=2 Tax=Folsomia candida TaxID=158441 RepID=A0A226DJD9_FOLCA|nr:uncharacterized protein LOC118437954 [Folsomia candida]XP_035713445.1 uncharacterized protein LOC118437954 [Folsomia candida]OXA45108.1 hypothetical protein Fcan01_20138 [Folsomia candida]
MSFESLGTFAPGAVGIFDPKAPRELKGPHDRHCVECGLVIYRQAKERLDKCPYKTCKAPMMLRDGFDANSKWGRCRICDSFIHSFMSFCQSCGTSNTAGINRKRRLEKIEQNRLEAEVKKARMELQDPDFLLWKAEKAAREEEVLLAAAAAVSENNPALMDTDEKVGENEKTGEGTGEEKVVDGKADEWKKVAETETARKIEESAEDHGSVKGTH